MPAKPPKPPGPSPVAFFVVLLVVVGPVVTGLRALPLGAEGIPPSGPDPSPTATTSSSAKPGGVGESGLTDSALYPLRVRGTCPAAVRIVTNRADYKKQVNDLLGCLETLYQPLIEQAKGSFSKVSHTFYDKAVTSPCGRETDAYAFYCESDGTIYFSEQVYADAGYQRLSVAEVVIHEYGHHVQAMMHIFRLADQLKESQAIIVRREELQVFCWTYYVFASVGSFELSDADRSFFLDVWSHTDDAEGHGSVKAQQYWGARGLNGENLGACNTWAVTKEQVR